MKKHLIAALLAALPLIACSQPQNTPTASAPIASQAAAQTASGVWIDVRTTEEFGAGHLDGAHNIPHQAIAQGVADLNLPKDAEIHLYCHSGRRAGIALEELKKLGYTNVVNEGGFEEVKQRLAK